MKSRVSVLMGAFIFVALLACGKAPDGQQPGNHPNEPTIVTDRPELQFGLEFDQGVWIGTSKQESLLIENDGLEPLEISNVTKTGDSEFTMELPTDLTVPPLGHTFIRFFFAPKEEKGYSATVTISSNAANEPEKVIQLSGRGVSPDAADGGM